MSIIVDDFKKLISFRQFRCLFKYRNWQTEQMFEKDIEILWQIYYSKYKEFRTNVLAWRWKRRGYIMNDATKELIIQMVKKLDDSDKKFLRQLYTILRRHLGKGKR